MQAHRKRKPGPSKKHAVPFESVSFRFIWISLRFLWKIRHPLKSLDINDCSRGTPQVEVFLQINELNFWPETRFISRENFRVKTINKFYRRQWYTHDIPHYRCSPSKSASITVGMLTLRRNTDTSCHVIQSWRRPVENRLLFTKNGDVCNMIWTALWRNLWTKLKWTSRCFLHVRITTCGDGRVGEKRTINHWMKILVQIAMSDFAGKRYEISSERKLSRAFTKRSVTNRLVASCLFCNWKRPFFCLVVEF